MFKYLRGMLLVFGVSLFILLNNNPNVVAGYDSLGLCNDSKVNEVNTKLLKLDEKLHELFGEYAMVSSLGYVTVNKKGVIQVNLKKEYKETAKSLYSLKNDPHEFVKWLKSEGIKVNMSAKYSEEELVTTANQVMADIALYYNSDFPKGFTLAVEPDVEKQKIRLKYNFSDKLALESGMLKQLEKKYATLLVTEDTTFEKVAFVKSKTTTSNELSGGHTVTTWLHENASNFPYN